MFSCTAWGRSDQWSNKCTFTHKAVLIWTKVVCWFLGIYLLSVRYCMVLAALIPILDEWQIFKIFSLGCLTVSMCPIGLPVHSKAVGGVILPVLDKDINALGIKKVSDVSLIVLFKCICKKSVCIKSHFVNLIKIRRLCSKLPRRFYGFIARRKGMN